ncbi:MAG TPA: protein kinase [Candidatus Eisenbacteria bacterium]
MATIAGNDLAHYRLIEQIGQGGMGVVWKALDLTLGRMVAIKILPEAVARESAWLSRLELEARTVAALNHPGIVTIYSIEEDAGVRFLTMELVPGRTLAESIPAGGLPLRDLLDVAVPLTDAIAAAHERGVVHRDLKPANVMVTAEGRVKVLDFGLAVFEAPEPGDSTGGAGESRDGASRLSGTPAYMSPEQLRGEPADHRSDLFAIGVMLFEAATGRRPWAAETGTTVVASILNEPPAPLTALRPDLPAALERLVGRCLEKDPVRRPASARALLREIEAVRRELGAARRAAAPALAVLPFHDLSRGGAEGHLCDGIAEEIINAMARLEGVRVASRTSSFRYRGSLLDARAIGRELGVDALLEGGVHRDGTRLRVTVELTAVRDGICLWSQKYDRETRDVFAIQEEIATRIAESLQIALSAGERHSLGRAATRDLEAYELYLRGRQYFYQYSRRGMQFALELFGRAIARDPGFALAYAGVADCHAYLWQNFDRSDTNRGRADEASRRALELDPALAQGHVSRGVALSLAGDHAGAEAEFETALRMDPWLFEAFYFYARDAFVRGDLERAIELYETAAALRPEDYQAPLLMAQVYDDLGRGPEAQAARRRGVAVAERHLEAHPDDARALYMAANGLVALGERERGLAWVERALALEPDDAMLLYNAACVRSLAGQTEEALATLERAVRGGLVYREWVESDSNLAPLRAHPRYRALLERMGGGA